MTDGSFPPPPGFQPPQPPAMPPGGYIPASPQPGYPPPGYPPPPPPRKSRTGCWLGCGGGCLVLIVLAIVSLFFVGPLTSFALQHFGLSWLTSGEVMWHAASPDGAREAQLRRFGVGQAQLAYSLTVTAAGGQGDRCVAAFMFGPQVESYTQVQWLTPTSLSVRYGQPTAGGSAFQAPTTNTGSGACTGITVQATHDPSLDAAADAAYAGGPNAVAVGNDGAGDGKDGRADVPPYPDGPPPADAPATGGGK